MKIFYQLNFVILLSLNCLGCKYNTNSNTEIYTFHDNDNRIVVTTESPSHRTDGTPEKILYITKNTDFSPYILRKRRIAEDKNLYPLQYDALDASGEKCVRQQICANKHPFDTLLEHSALIEIMNFLLTYYKGTDEERANAAFNYVHNTYGSGEQRINDSLHHVLVKRYSTAQRDTVEMLRSEILHNLDEYRTPRYRKQWKAKYSIITEATTLRLVQYNRAFSLESYCAFQESYAIMNHIKKNFKGKNKIYTLSFGLNVSRDILHDPYEYVDVFTEFDFYKDNNGVLKVREKILNPSNIARMPDC